jgi:NAD(P)-dependent dehydrogenase (short-subunit alcohol dehydrogenase family)
MSEGKKLQGKVAVITGGSTGIGLAAAKLFVEEGAYVFITGGRQKELEAAVKAIGSNVSGVQGDVAKLADLDRLYEAVKTKGRIDVVFANAGVAEFAPLDKITSSSSSSKTSLTLLAPMSSLRAVLRAFLFRISKLTRLTLRVSCLGIPSTHHTSFRWLRSSEAS